MIDFLNNVGGLSKCYVVLDLKLVQSFQQGGLIGNSVPVATMGAFLRQAVEAVLKVLPAVEVASAEAREEAGLVGVISIVNFFPLVWILLK